MIDLLRDNTPLIGILVSTGILIVGILALCVHLKNRWDKRKNEEKRKRLEIRSAQPNLKGSGGRYHEKAGYFLLTNYGGEIRHIKVEPIGNFSIKYTPKNCLRKNDKLRIDVVEMPQPLPEKLAFKISYTDQFGEQQDTTYSYIFKDRVWREENKAI